MRVVAQGVPVGLQGTVGCGSSFSPAATSTLHAPWAVYLFTCTGPLCDHHHHHHHPASTSARISTLHFVSSSTSHVPPRQLRRLSRQPVVGRAGRQCGAALHHDADEHPRRDGHHQAPGGAGEAAQEEAAEDARRRRGQPCRQRRRRHDARVPERRRRVPARPGRQLRRRPDRHVPHGKATADGMHRARAAG